MFISFAWTTEPFLANAKRVTRRYWKESHAKKFKKGMIVEAYDKLPFRGGNKIGEIRLTRDPYQQQTSMMGSKDFILEGLQWMGLHGIKINGLSVMDFFDDWVERDDLVWVVEFEKL